ncbi:MAG: B12-binding domain-containing radical SAM protein [Sandaracinaceae bacterium]|nr:B12-binding domain-containing radical SAM protein [Sandaracinaceae bacterium]
MRLTLASVYSHDRCTLKDVAGGFGTVFEVGRSWQARLLERAKSRLAELPPVVLGHLAARLRGLGHEVRIATSRHEDAAEAAGRCGGDAVLLHSSLVDSAAERALLDALRARGMRTIVFGAAATSVPDLYLSHADVVLRGEPEGASDELWRELLQGGAEGAVDVGSVPDLDALPFPDWSPFPVERYRYALLSTRGVTLPIQSARGCPYGCGYCPWRVTAAFRERHPALVVEEARRDRDVFGASALSFRDPLFNLDPDRVVAIAEGLAPLRLRWSAEMRADRLDRALLRTLARAGLRSLELGVESVDRELLVAEKRKPPTHAQIEAVVRDARELGIRVICNYVLGLPGDTVDTMRATVRWAKSLNSFAVQFTVATPYPGTSLERRGALKVLDQADQLTGFHATRLEGSVSPTELEDLREWAYVSYHFRPRYVASFVAQAARALLD